MTVATDNLRAEVERLRHENETLYGVVGVVGSSPDLRHVLDRVVDLLTKASACHACFIYVLRNGRLGLRAASPVYAHLVGRIEFGLDEGLAGWAVRNAQPAFIKDHALDDPRTNNVPELEEERFQSMVAVPIPSRAGEPLGVIVLHTEAPREFDEGILNVLTHAGSLVAGAIENAKLYEESQRRVWALTELSNLSEQISATLTREELYKVATRGARTLLQCSECQLFELDEDGRFHTVAADPGEGKRELQVDRGVDAVLSLVEAGRQDSPARRAAIAAAFGLDDADGVMIAAPVTAARERLGLLVAVVSPSENGLAGELLRSVAHQIALAMKKMELIERLTEENLARDLFDALTSLDDTAVATLAHAAHVDLERPALVLEVRPGPRGVDGPQWSDVAQTVETALRRTAAGAVCDPGPMRMRTIVPMVGEDPDDARRLVARLAKLAESEGVVIGASTSGRGTDHLRQALDEAGDAATVASALQTTGHALFCGDMGAYRYLVNLVESGGPKDRFRAAVDRLIDYDQRRQSQLVGTLETYLEQARSTTATARALIIHVNTLRQRLQRIEELTGLDLASEDLLALHLAIKLARLRGATD